MLDFAYWMLFYFITSNYVATMSTRFDHSNYIKCVSICVASGGYVQLEYFNMQNAE